MRKLTLQRDCTIATSSDWHIGHSKVLQHSTRPFATIEDHDAELVRRANETVGRDGVLVLVGDLAWKRTGLEWLKDSLLVKEVYCVVGNHDREAELRRVFGESRVFERLRLKVIRPWGVRRAVLDHYPGDSWLDWNHGTALLHGHQHSVRPWYRSDLCPKWSLSCDVGVDGNDYRPWLWDDLWKDLDRRLPKLQTWLARKDAND